MINLRPHEVPYPHNDNAAIFSPYIGERVVYVHREYCGIFNSEPMPFRQGTLMTVQAGCNGLLAVQWDDRDYLCHEVPSDCSLLKTYPQQRWTHEEPI